MLLVFQSLFRPSEVVSMTTGLSGCRPGKPAAAQTGEGSNGTFGEYCSGIDTLRIGEISDTMDTVWGRILV